MRHTKISIYYIFGILILCLISCNTNEKGSIKMFHSDFGDYSFVTYNKPNYDTYKTDKTTMHSFSFSYNGFDYSAGYFKMDTVVISDELTLNKLTGGIIGKPGVNLTSIKNISYFGHPGIEIEGMKSDGIAWRFKLLLIDHYKVYQFGVFNDGLKTLDTPEVETFFRSFEKNVINKKKTTPPINQYVFKKDLSLEHLISLLYVNIGFSERLLVKNEWEKAFEFDKLKIIEGNEYHVYNFMYPDNEDFILLAVAPFKYIIYVPNQTNFINLRNYIALNYELVSENMVSGIRKLLFKSEQDKVFINLRDGMNSIEIWRGLDHIDGFGVLNKNALLHEFGLN